MKTKIPAWLVLTVICVVAAVLLAVTNLITLPTIQQNAAREAMATRLALLPGSVTFEELENGVSQGLDQDNNVIGYAATGVAQGFGGDVETTVVLLSDGTISGVSVGGANFAETAGLGARAKEPEFQEQFVGKKVPVELSKNGGEIDALSGATITSKAVIKGANAAVASIADEIGLEVESAGPVVFTDGNDVYWITTDGFGGPVIIQLTKDPDGSILAFAVSAESETPGLGLKAQDAAFTDQFVGKSLPLHDGDVDAITGATITSTAVFDGVSAIADAIVSDSVTTAELLVILPVGQESDPIPEEEPAKVPDEQQVQESGESTTDTVYTAKAQGCVGPVTVTLTLDAEGKIATFVVNAESETPGLGQKAQDAEFTDKFIGKTLPLEDGAIDAISGATVTTNAVLAAVREISDTIGVGAPEEKSAENAEDKSYSAEAQGCVGPVTVTLTLDAEGKIAMFVVNAESETPGLGQKAQDAEFTDKFIGKTLPLEDGAIDAISGATVTTNAVLAAVKEIAGQLQ